MEQLVRRNGNVRLCKGAYVEQESMAFTGREEIRQNFMKLLRRLLETGCPVGIATHDEVLVQGAYRSIEEMKGERGAYEFQMLHGVRPRLRWEILRAGHRVRVYVPFGKEWYGYAMRRFKENPQIARYVLRALFSKD
jgi:proline dehydrogenase